MSSLELRAFCTSELISIHESVVGFLKIEKISNIAPEALTEKIINEVCFIRKSIEEFKNDRRVIETEELRDFHTQAFKAAEVMIKTLPRPNHHFECRDTYPIKPTINVKGINEEDYLKMPSAWGSSTPSPTRIYHDEDYETFYVKLHLIYSHHRAALRHKRFQKRHRKPSLISDERTHAAVRSYRILKDFCGVEPKITVYDKLMGLSSYAELYKLVVGLLGFHLQSGVKPTLIRAKKIAEAESNKPIPYKGWIMIDS